MEKKKSSTELMETVELADDCSWVVSLSNTLSFYLVLMCEYWLKQRWGLIEALSAIKCPQRRVSERGFSNSQRGSQIGVIFLLT